MELNSFQEFRQGGKVVSLAEIKGAVQLSDVDWFHYGVNTMIIPGVIISIDLERKEDIEGMVNQTHQLPSVLGYKIGALCSLSLGIHECVRIIRSRCSKLIVYDHQKAGNDIPDISRRLVRFVAQSGVNYFVIFPFAGPLIMQEIINVASELDLTVIVGAHLTNQYFRKSEGGFIPDEVPRKIFDTAVELGIVDFVIPGNLPITAASYVEELFKKIQHPKFWAPGIGNQGGSISKLQNVLLPQSHLIPILGSSIYSSSDPAQEVARIING